MKRIMLCWLILLILAGCESPLDIGPVENDQVNPALFLKNLYVSEGDYSVGYASGRVQSDRILMEWEPYADDDFVFYRLKPGNSSAVIFNDVSVTSFLDTIYVEQDEEYLFELLVMTKTGMHAKDSLMIRTPRWSAPDGLAANRLNNNDIILSWYDNCDTEDHFLVYLLNSEMTVIDSTVTVANVTQQFFSGLEYMEQYHAYVKVSGEWEEDLSSYELGFLSFLGDITAPAELAALQNTDTTVSLNWQDGSNNETGFCLERSINDADFLVLAFLDFSPGYGAVVEFLDEDTLAYSYGDILRYRVRACNDYEEEIIYSDYSNIVEVVIGDYSEQVLIHLQVDNWFDEASWNLFQHDSQEYFYESDQTFSENYQQILQYFDLLPGDYSLCCWDSFGDGGITGSITYHDIVIAQWDQDDYNYGITIDFSVGE